MTTHPLEPLRLTMQADLDALEARMPPAPPDLIDVHGVRWTWRSGDLYVDSRGRGWPLRFLDVASERAN